MEVQVHWTKHLGSHAGHQEVSSCHTRGESEESIVHGDEACDLGQMSPEVQNRNISGPRKRLMSSKLKTTTRKPCP